MRYKLIVFFSFVLMLNAYPSDVKFYNINDIYGISKRAAFSVCKDNNGFIWTSFKTGIVRLSEGDYHIYQLPFNTANVINTKVVYENSLLIAYTNNGQIFLYDEICDCFNLLVDLRQVLDFQYISMRNIIVDERKSLWIASSFGLYKYENNQLTSILKKTINSHYITPYDESHFFIATEKGIDLLNVHTLEVKNIYSFQTGTLDNVVCLFYDKKNDQLWIGTNSDGLFFYKVTDKYFYKAPIEKFPLQPILSIEENTNSTILIGIDGQGVWELTQKGDSVLNIYMEDVNNPLSLSGDGVYDILCDDKRVWVATYGGGLSFFEKEIPLVSRITHQLNNSNSLANNYINDIIEDSNGHIWFATNNGISRWNVTSNKWNHFYQDKKEQAKVFLTINEDINGDIWAGTYSSGIYVLDGSSGEELDHFYKENLGNKMSGKFIYDFLNDSEGNIWIGGIEDVICYITKEKRFRSYNAQPVRTFRELPSGEILLACTYGMLLLDKKTEKYKLLLGDYLVQDIRVDNDNIWVATAGDGLVLYNYKDKTSKKFTTESGLPSNSVSSIICVDGFLWIGTDNGLCRLKTSNNTIVSYSSIYSLSNIAFNVNSVSKLKNGNLIWGTNDGAIMFNPDSIQQISFQGHIFFQDINISGRSIRENENIELTKPINELLTISLKHDQNTLALELIPMGVSYIGAKFSWIMKGLDTEWNKPSNNSIVSYTNLPSGDFSLKIRMYDSSLSQVIDERSLTIHIIPPFWKTWWFRLLFIIFIVGVLLYSLNLYIRRLKRLHNEDKMRFFINMAHDIRTSLTLINAPIEELNKGNELSKESKYYLNIATEQSKRLSFVTTQLLDFQKVDIGKGQLFLVMVDIVKLTHQRILMFESSTKEKNIELLFNTNLKSFSTALDELKVEKVIDNLISNAIKYSYPNSKIDIILTCKDKEWSLEVKDYGFGISDKEKKKLFKEFYRGNNSINSKIIGSGIGLLLVKNYVNLHNGRIQLNSKENEGSSFKIFIPFKEVDIVALSVADKVDRVCDEQNDKQSTFEEKSKKKKKKSVLIVEDNSDLQNFLKHSLQTMYDIYVANDGVEAWNTIQKKSPDLIISDVMMPNMDGFELCKLVKSTFETSHIPLILLTALSDKTKQLEGLGLGADDYITKPFDVSILQQRIKTIVSNREIIREKALKLIRQNDNEQPIINNELNDQFVKKALKIVRDNIANSEFGKDEFASSMFVSSSLLYKKMKSLTNQSPSDFIKTIRLDYALELLKSHKYTVTEISELSGFSSINYFSRTFKSYFGKTPTDI